MMKTLQPIETEYCGVTFRSKTEAVFARCMDLVGAPWTYEPAYYDPPEYTPLPEGVDEFDPDCWTPDFLIGIPNSWRFHAGCRRQYFNAVIEVKPSEPTMSYVTTVADKYQRMFLLHEQETTPLIILWGMWDNDPDAWFFPFPPDSWIQFSEAKSRLGRGHSIFIKNWRPFSALIAYLAGSWDEARSYRFDLKTRE
jgi:hypothetical protein